MGTPAAWPSISMPMCAAAIDVMISAVSRANRPASKRVTASAMGGRSWRCVSGLFFAKAVTAVMQSTVELAVPVEKTTISTPDSGGRRRIVAGPEVARV